MAAGKTTFYIRDHNSGGTFLVDTGAQVSVLPATVWDRRGHKGSDLKAANQTPIYTYGRWNLMLKFGDKRFEKEFIIADVPNRILGMDFFEENQLSIDAKNKEIFTRVDNATICQVAVSDEPRGERDLFDLLDKFPKILTPNFDDTSNKHRVQHYIKTTGNPVFARPRRLDQEKLEAAKKEFAELERLGIIRRSDSPWSSPLHVVPKANGKLRPCGDYRRLNEMTEDDKYPLPHIHDFNAKLIGAKVFSKVDLIRGYHQIPVAAEDIQKTAICTPFGLWEYVRMPFGLKNAAQRFQRLMDHILDGLPWCFVYLDDILIASKTMEQHKEHLEELFKILENNGLVVNRAKCELGVPHLDFLGHRVTSQGVAPMPDRVTAIQNYPTPKDKPALQRFLGMINYYHRFLPNIAKKLIPLHLAVGNKKGKTIEWSAECGEAFEAAKVALANAALLSHPARDAETTITVDASDTAMGGQLEQKIAGKFRPIAFFSKKLSAAERKYSAFDCELLGIYSAIRHFRNFVEGRCFTVFTDHKPLTTALASQTERSPRQTRHLSFIAEFTSDIRHVRGVENEVADALSRVDAISQQIDVAELAAEQAKSSEVASYVGDTTSGLEVTKVTCGQHELICDVSTGRTRPVVPLSMRRSVFDAYHGLSHTGPRPTQKAILRKFVWKNLKKDVIEWCRACDPCQTSKVARHTLTPWSKRVPPDRRFGSIHVDLVGPLPESEGHKYLFTVVDRWTRWPEAIPLVDMTAKSCARALLRHWVARFGLPSDVTTDRGRQFTSDLWTQMNKMLGIKNNTTTAYHPMANGLVERLHRQLKSSIMARSTGVDWMEQLPLVMLGIRTAWRTELDCSPAELVYGTALTVPGSMIGDHGEQSQDRQSLPTSDFVENLFRSMRELSPTEMAHHATAKVQYRQRWLTPSTSTSGRMQSGNRWSDHTLARSGC